MAFRVLRVCEILTNSVKNNQFAKSVTNSNLLRLQAPLVQSTRNTSFFNKRPAEQLWKSVTSVSNAGRRRGRARGIGRKRDLNRGQVLGFGKTLMQFPGLNAPVFRGRELLKQTKLPPNPERENKIIEMRNQMTTKKRFKLSPLERGWSGGKAGGRKIGPPDSIGEDTFEGFESWILESKMVSTMTSNLGRKRSASVMVVTGNGNGIAGFAVKKATTALSATKSAKNRAGQKLMYIERYNDHTVLHDFFTRFGSTKIFVKQMHQGYGLVCHRAIKACCEAIGIKDLHANIEGSTNLQHIVKAFFIGLLQQKTHQELANEKKLHLVEFRRENRYFPTVVASPDTVRTRKEIPLDEVLDFTQHVMGGKIVLQKKKFPPFYTKLPHWPIYQRKQERVRGQDEVRLRLKVEYGQVCSFFFEKYPEAKLQMWRKKPEQVEE